MDDIVAIIVCCFVFGLWAMCSELCSAEREMTFAVTAKRF